MRQLLVHWARDNGMSRDKAYREHHQGTLRDSNGDPVETVRDGGRIYVVHSQRNWAGLDQESADELVGMLLRAGYVVLTSAEAGRLGIRR